MKDIRLIMHQRPSERNQMKQFYNIKPKYQLFEKKNFLSFKKNINF